jgi:hypothetical protein
MPTNALIAVVFAAATLLASPSFADKAEFIDLVYPPDDSVPANDAQDSAECTVAVAVSDLRDEDSRLGRGKLLGVIEKRNFRLLTDDDLVDWVRSAYAYELRGAGNSVIQLDRDMAVDGALSLRVEITAVELDCGMTCKGKVELRSTLAADETVTATTKAEEGGFTVILRRYGKPASKALAAALESAIQRTLADLGLDQPAKNCPAEYASRPQDRVP